MHTTRQALRAAKLLTSRAMDRYELAEALGVSDRQALRIAQMLIGVGIATSARPTAGGVVLYRVPKGLKISQISA